MKVVNIRKSQSIPNETVRQIIKIIKEDKEKCVIYVDKTHVLMGAMNKN